MAELLRCNGFIFCWGRKSKEIIAAAGCGEYILRFLEDMCFRKCRGGLSNLVYLNQSRIFGMSVYTAEGGRINLSCEMGW